MSDAHETVKVEIAQRTPETNLTQAQPSGSISEEAVISDIKALVLACAKDVSGIEINVPKTETIVSEIEAACVFLVFRIPKAEMTIPETETNLS